MNVNWKQIGATAALAAAMAVPIYGSGGQVNTLAGRYSAPLALAVGTGASSVISQLITDKYNTLQYDVNEPQQVAFSDLLLYESAITGVSNAAMYMNDRPGVAAVIGASSQILGSMVATSLFVRQ
jgi:hypothetical protein